MLFRSARDTNVAFHAAETAVSDAEVFIDAMASLTVAGFPGDLEDEVANAKGTAGLHTSLGGNDYWACSESPGCAAIDLSYMDDDSGNTNYRVATTTLSSSADEPKYVVEYVKKVTIEEDTLNIGNIGEQLGSGTAYVFRITARGTGATAQSHVVIQTLYGRQF